MVFTVMRIYQLVICCVLFTSTVCSSIVHALPELANLRHFVDRNIFDCNCENGDCVTDKEGHSLCICRPGFVLQDDFTCKPCNCGSLGKCIFIPKLSGSQIEYQKKCICDTGCAEKDGVCVDCFCGEKSGCEFVFGERRCYCLDGFSEKDGVCTRCDCGLYGKCNYENGDKECECYERYLELNGMCEECNCGDHGKCSFVNGQKTCECEPRYSVNNGKCEQCDCGDHGNCLFVNGQKTCQCEPRYSVNDGICEQCDCGDNGNCSFVNGQKTCDCEPRYSVNDGKCERCDCGLFGECEYKNGDKKCECNEGYLELNGLCEECNCGNHGTCSFVNGQQTCMCEAGYSVNNGKCEQCDCGDRGNCSFVNGQKTCDCEPRYSVNDGKCERCDCGLYGSCGYDNRDKKCECNKGYLELNGTCEECDCGNDGECFFENGQKKCKCSPGFSVDNGICKPCDCGLNSVACIFIQGVKKCSCKDRYADKLGTCEECNCGQYSRSCNFSENQKVCSCFQGYVQKGETCENGCSNQTPCQNGGYCKGGFCFCLHGTRGKFCDVIDDCPNLCPNKENITCDYDVGAQKAYCKCLDSNLRYNPNLKECRRICTSDRSCRYQGRCIGISHNKFCHCLEGTTGDFCEVIPACVGVNCGSDANCVFNALTKSVRCVCKDSGQYYDSKKGKCRKLCEKDKDCHNGGHCSGKGSNRFCDCLPGTHGDHCDTIDDCASGRMKCNEQESYCTYHVKKHRALCQCKHKDKEYDYSRGKCRRDCDKDKECMNGGKCRDTDRNKIKFCDCLRGTQGDKCEIVDDCASGQIKCKGNKVSCDFDEKNLKAFCRCKDKGKDYDSEKEKCTPHRGHKHSRTDWSSNESSEEEDFF